MHVPLIIPLLLFWIFVFATITLAKLSQISQMSLSNTIEPAENSDDKNLLRKLLEIFDFRQSSSTQGDASRLEQAQQLMQCAIDQQVQADSASCRSQCGNRYARMTAATQAQGHAASAQDWAARSAAAASGVSGPAQDAARRARNAAYQAQASASRARYNAETCPI